MNQNGCSPHRVPGHWKLSSSSCSSVNIELFTTITWYALEFVFSKLLNQWKLGGKEYENNDKWTFLFFSHLIWGSGIYFSHRSRVSDLIHKWKNLSSCHTVIVLKRSKVCEMYPISWLCIIISLMVTYGSILSQINGCVFVSWMQSSTHSMDLTLGRIKESNSKSRIKPLTCWSIPKIYSWY